MTAALLASRGSRKATTERGNGLGNGKLRPFRPAGFLLAVLVLGAPELPAQAPGGAVEARVDALAAAHDAPAAVHFGGGLTRPLGTYVRAALLAGAGPSRDGSSARVEGLIRFHLDPVRERPWGVYAAVGGGVLWNSGGEPYLALLLGAEGPRRGTWATAFEAGLSRGARFAVVLRRASATRR